MELPKKKFVHDQELRIFLLWWKDRLGLNDWSISAKLVDSLYDEEGRELAGKNEMQILHKAAYIYISRADLVDDESSLIRVCQEKTLVHELLHCLYNWLKPPSSIEGVFFDEMDHQRLEMLARSLICVKYGLHMSWWDNTESGGESNE